MVKTLEGNKWIEFRLVANTTLTQRWEVINKHSNNHIAEIRWYPTWRQYTMFPEPETVFNDGCLETILNFIKRLNKEKQIV